MSWRLRHQIIIFLIVTSFFAATGGLLYFIYHPRESCTDGKQNQNELAVDCGGVCAQVCQVEVVAPVIWWQRALAVKTNTYDVAALIENKLNSFGLSRLEYLFRLYDENQILVATLPGTTFVNPNEQTVLFVPNVEVGEREISRVSLTLATSTWQRLAKPAPVFLSVTDKRFTNQPFPEVRAVVRNDSLEIYRDVEVLVVLSDAERNVFGVSKTMIDTLDPGTVREVFFSWPEPFGGEQSVEPLVDIYPRINTLAPKPF